MSRIQNFYDTTFDVIRPAQNKDSGGAIIPDETTTALSDQLGKLDLLTGSKIVRDERGALLANFLLICDNISIIFTDQIKITSGLSTLYNDKIFVINSIDDTTLRGRNPHLEIYLRLFS